MLLDGIVLLVLGILAAASSIVAKRPDAQSYIDKLVPYQGWIGFIACIWGIWIVIASILSLGLVSLVPIWWLTIAATGVLNFALGLLLGYSLLTKYLLSKNAEAMKRGEQVRAKLVPYQVTLGYIAILVGIWAVLDSLLGFHI
ncbi:MAG TPA: hypothetical protein VKT70_04345 [Stellaceae bacterium]|nr:hypothetical protein [Stellaceae bacterium]